MCDKGIRKNCDVEGKILPGYSRYIIFKNGVVFNRLSGKELSGSRNPAGYINFRLTDDVGKTKTFGRHRLLCSVFKPHVNENKLFVNHLNGVKGSDEIDNLEWVTPLENVHHAGLTGLSKKCIPISVKDSTTGVIKKYNSIIDCSRDLGLTKDAVIHRLTKNDRYIFPEKKQYRKGHDIDDWESPLDDHGELKVNVTDKSIFVKNLVTGKISFYAKLSDFCKVYDIKQSTLSCWLHKHHQPVLPGLLQIKFVKDEGKWRYVHDPVYELSLLLNTKPIKVTDLKTNEIKLFVSATECSAAYGISKTLLNYRLKEGSGKSYNNHTFEYLHFNQASPNN